MTTRRLGHPVIEIEDHDEGLLVRFYAPGSKFGSVEIVLDVEEAERLADDLGDAAVFAFPESVARLLGGEAAPPDEANPGAGTARSESGKT